MRNFACNSFGYVVNSARTQHRRCSSGVEQRIRNAWVVSSNLTSGFPSGETGAVVFMDIVPP